MRFLGRRVYVSVAVVVAAAAEDGVTLRRVRLLGELLGQAVDRRTLERWVQWWRQVLPASRSWKGLRIDWSTVQGGGVAGLEELSVSDHPPVAG